MSKKRSDWILFQIQTNFGWNAINISVNIVYFIVVEFVRKLAIDRLSRFGKRIVII